MGIIYCSKNKINGKCYIGKTTTTLTQRISQHLSDSKTQKDNTYFHNAINKYGISAFEWTIIDSCEDNIMLNQLERLHISRYESQDKNYGYNLTVGGEGSCGLKWSKSARKKKSNSMKGSKNHFYGKRHSLESLKKMSKNCSSKRPEVREKISRFHKGKKLSERHKQKLREVQKGKNQNKNIRKKISIAKNGKGLFGFTACFSNKKAKPWGKVWTCSIRYKKNRFRSLGFNDPLSCQIIYEFIWNEIYGVE